MGIVLYYRDKFEEHMVSIGEGNTLAKYGDGHYAHRSTAIRFETWKAACRELARQEEQKKIPAKWDGEINMSDFRVDTYTLPRTSSWSLPRDTAVRVTHVPTGIYAESSEYRGQHRNKAEAIEEVKKKLNALKSKG